MGLLNPSTLYRQTEDGPKRRQLGADGPAMLHPIAGKLAGYRAGARHVFADRVSAQSLQGTRVCYKHATRVACKYCSS